MPGSQIVSGCGRIKTSKAKIRRARLGKGGGGPVSPQPPRVFRISFLLNDFSPLSRSLEQANLKTKWSSSVNSWQMLVARETTGCSSQAMWSIAFVNYKRLQQHNNVTNACALSYPEQKRPFADAHIRWEYPRRSTDIKVSLRKQTMTRDNKSWYSVRKVNPEK